MNRKRKISTLVLYELRNMAGNPYIHIFGIAMPIFFGILFTKIATSETAQTMTPYVATSVAGSISMIIPMAVILMGAAVSTALELEKKIPVRMELFGISEKKIIAARMIAEMILVSIALILYSICMVLFNQILEPAAGAMCIWIGTYLVFSAVLFMLAYGIANLTRKFGLTYCITMILYFAMMVMSGIMGISIDQMPKPIQMISRLLPSSYISTDLMDFWQGGSYNLMPLIQSFLFLGAVSGIILFYSVYRAKRS